MSDQNDKPNLGADGTIPNTSDGIAVGHDPDGTNFNPEEDNDEIAPPVSTADLPDGSGTISDALGNSAPDDDTASGGTADK